MTEVIDNNEDLPQESELDSLKAKAKLMGIKFHPSSGVDSLKAKIEEATSGEPAPAEPAVEKAPALTKAETANAARVKLKKEATKLVRVNITCMNPNKKDWDGEIFTTGNMVTGTIKKMVPFNVDFHVPQMILTMIEQRYCQVFHTTVDPATRRKTNQGKQIKEFAIRVLPPLTPEELSDLAQRQAMAAGTSA